MPTRQPVVATSQSHLKELVDAELERLGPACDLNHIDVSRIVDMDFIFEETNFCGDISQWDVSRVTSMIYTFRKSVFTGDISRWNVGQLVNAEGMFTDSQFNSDISGWNVGNVENMRRMFSNSPFNGDLSQWNVWRASQSDMHAMFKDCTFDGDLSSWQLDEHARGIHHMLDKNFMGIPPVVKGAPSRFFYYAMFGTMDIAAKYLERMPFNAMHFDMACAAKNVPPGISVQDYAWCHQHLELGQHLQLRGPELRSHALNHYPGRNNAQSDPTICIGQLVDD